MSLINNVLRDLDEREIKNQKSDELSTSGPVRPVSNDSLSSKRIYLYLFIGFLTICTGGVLTNQLSSSEKFSNPIAQNSPSTVTPSLIEAPIEQVEPNNSDISQQVPNKTSSKESSESAVATAGSAANSNSDAITTQNNFSLPETAISLETDGILALRESSSNSGEALLRKALDLDPKLFKARLALARHVESGNRREEATLILSDGLMLLPNSPSLFLELARINIRAGDTELAYELLDTALQKNQMNVNLNGLYAELSKERNHWVVAINHFRIALAKNNNNIKWRIGLADSLFEIKEFEAAKDEYNAILLLSNLNSQQRKYIEYRLM